MFPGQSINYINKRCLYLDFFFSQPLFTFSYINDAPGNCWKRVAKFYYFVDYF